MATPLDKAIKACGTQAEFIRRLGKPVRSSHLWNWINRDGGKVPAHFVLAVEKACGGVVTRYDLRPDVFGKKPTSVAA